MRTAPATPAGDRIETAGDQEARSASTPTKLAVSATKPMYGHPLGAERRHRGGRLHQGDAGQLGAADDGPRPARTRSATSTTSRTSAARGASATRCRTPSASPGSIRPSCSVRRRHRPQRKSRPRGPASSSWPAEGSHCPAGSSELALTRRTVTLVIAPEEHPFPVGLGSKRATRLGTSRSVSRHTVDRGASCATPSREVVLRLSLASAAVDACDRVPRPAAATGQLEGGGFARRRSGSGRGPRKVPRRRQSESCWRRPHPCPPRSRQFCSACSAHASLRCGTGSRANRPLPTRTSSGAGALSLARCRRRLQPPGRHCSTAFADLVNKRLTRRVAAAGRSGGHDQAHLAGARVHLDRRRAEMSPSIWVGTG